MRRIIVMFLVGALFASEYVAAELPEGPSATSQAIHTQATKFATSQKSATAELNDGSKVSGIVLSADENRFVVRESKTGKDRTLAYDQVTRLKRKGLHPAVKAALIVGAALLGGAIVVASRMD